MRRKTMYCLGAVLMTAALALAACGGSRVSAPGMGGAPPMETAAYDVAAAETAAYKGEMQGSPISREESGITDSSPVSQALPSGRKLIRNVSMTVETDGFDQLLKTLTAQVAELGGYVEQSDISGNSMNYQNQPIPRYGNLTVRIPITRLDGFISTVEQNGNVTNKSESTQDVTLQYSDLESKKKSLTVEQERIWALLEKADTLEAVIALEERLSEIRYQLESMESQLRLYDNQVEYSTVHLQVNEILGADSFTPTEPEGVAQRIQKGFARNLDSVSQRLTNFFVWILVTMPIWIPVALVVILVLALIRRVKRRTYKLPAPGAGDSGDKEDSPKE